MTTITVAHGQTCYDIMVGDLSSTLPEIDRLSGGRLLPLVSDKTVFGLHGAKLGDVAMLPPILVPSGEAAKDWDGLRQLVTALAERGVQRGTPIIALGGGSVGDLTGLAAALYMRGSPVIHVPTTLLAQADSAVGGKTAIDSNGVKNLVGLFHPPALVVVDPSLIDTLDPSPVHRWICGDREIRPDRRSRILPVVRTPWRGGRRTVRLTPAIMRSRIA